MMSCGLVRYSCYLKSFRMNCFLMEQNSYLKNFVPELRRKNHVDILLCYRSLV
jgi:hypothetical protein